MAKTVAFHTLGCKVNSYETAYIRQEMVLRGYEVVPFHERADIYIINTCSVTNIADQKSRQMIHRARKKNPDALVVATGCYVQAMRTDESGLEGVDLAVGNNHKAEIVNLIEETLSVRAVDSSARGRILHIDDIAAEPACESMRLTTQTEHTRAYIRVQDGCNQFCTYCIIPYVRGRIRSRLPEDVVQEVEGLVQSGYKEIVLTGIHLSSYGMDPKSGMLFLDGKPLLDLLKRLDEIPGLRRIRLGSLEPRIITEDFVRELSGLKTICPHFHLSLQSGCLETLRRMNRHYTPEEYLEGVRILRKYFDDPAVTTDVIVGFPGETEEEFEESRAFLAGVDFFEMHIFRYSRRKGTRADLMPDQVSAPVSEKRSAALLEMEKEMSLKFRRRRLKRDMEVLFEEIEEIDGRSYWVGHTPEYVRAAVRSDEDLRGSIRTVRGIEMLTDDIVFCLETSQ